MLLTAKAFQQPSSQSTIENINICASNDIFTTKFYGYFIVVTSTLTLMKTVSSTIKPPFISSFNDTKRGQPDATFMSDLGF